jgi:TolB-like protein/Flp pilus assembly protein TadD
MTGAQGRPGFRVAVCSAGFARSFWDVARTFQVTRIKIECCPDERFVKARTVNPKNFFAELRRRNVYKVAIAYGVVAWLLMQIASQIFPFFEIPNWAVRLVVLLLVIGFPVALILAWAFELTPEGIKRAEFADELPKKSAPSRAWIYVVIIAGAVSVALFFVGRYTAPNKQGGPAEVVTKSIAVLPFENLSHDPDNAYFADGIQEEILTRLSKIADLKVISRTSTQHFKSAPNNLIEIAKQLGVANILEGSVQHSADQVRVNVQLIKAANDSHLWADTFDRRVTDVFAVESEIAKAVADTLQAKLSGAEQSAIASQPTKNSEAHDLYLRGRYFFGKRGADNLKRAIDYFNQAIAKDPNYALAYAGLADSYALLPEYSTEPPSDEFDKAGLAADRAIALDNKLAEAHVSRGLVFATDYRLKEAKQEYQRAIELNPNDANAHYFLAFVVFAALGDSDHAIAEMNRALELDPFSVVMNINLGLCYCLARRYPEAIAQLRKTTELDPGSSDPHFILGVVYEISAEREQAITEYQRAIDLNPRHEADPTLLAAIYALKGERAKALEQLELARMGKAPAFFLAVNYLRLGDKSQAIDWLEQSYRNKEPFIASIKVNPLLDPLRGDLRFEALAEKIIPRDAK